MSHDSEAAFAYSEIANDIQLRAPKFVGSIGQGGTWSLTAGREGGSIWPRADGIIEATNSKTTKITNYNVNMAFEYKRVNEQLHGILTAIGQALAYIDKGYDASVICVPNAYPSHQTPGAQISQIINTNYPDAPIAVYTYLPPNLSALRPFAGKLNCERDIDLSTCRKPTRTAGAKKIVPSIETVWAHVREGESFPDAFFRYCQSAKIVSSAGEDMSKYVIDPLLANAVSRIKPGADPILYLSSTVGNSILDMTWRYVWYNYYLTPQLMPMYSSSSPYVVNDVPTKILKDPVNYQRLFSGRIDSIKEKLINDLNSPKPKNSLNDAWDIYAKKIHDTAHSYREVIDSGLDQLGLIDSEGALTNYGYMFVNACEKAGNVYDEVPMNILRAVTLVLGQYEVFLSTIFKYSNDCFNTNFNQFTKLSRKKTVLDKRTYLLWLKGIFVNQLHMLKVSTLRAGGTREPFQGEMAYLKNLGLIDSTNTYKIGTGLNINWPLIESSISYFYNL